MCNIWIILIQLYYSSSAGIRKFEASGSLELMHHCQITLRKEMQLFPVSNGKDFLFSNGIHEMFKELNEDAGKINRRMYLLLNLFKNRWMRCQIIYYLLLNLE